MKSIHPRLARLACAGLFPLLALTAQAPREARLPVKIVGDRLVVRCEVSTRFRRLPVNLLVDYGRPCGLELHNRAAAGLRLDEGGGLPVTVHFPGLDVPVARREHGDEDALNAFTRLYSRELGETACVGSLGSRFFDDYHATFDLASGLMVLRDPEEEGAPEPEPREGVAIVPVSISNDLVWLPVRVAEAGRRMLALGTGRHDTTIDRTLCRHLDAPDGAVGALRLGPLDLAQYAAFRPAEVALVHPDGVLGTTGLGLLAHLRLEVDRVNRRVLVSESRPPAFPEADLAYFKALVHDEPEALMAWLEAHPGERLAREAAETLLRMLLEFDGEDADLEKALRWMNDTRIEDLRCTEALTTMTTLLEARRPALAIKAGEIGVESGRGDRYPESVHKIHAKLGELLLEADENRRAWEHLLSAAFGLPQDGMINLNLGRFYEREKRYRRAMSRYIQAVIQPESGPQAVKALERLQEKTSGESLSVDLVDKMVQGKVYNFGAATRFEPDETNATNRVVLAELFTNPHLAQKLPEGWRSFAVGGAMGLEGLASHFPRTHLAIISYHVDRPEPSPLMNELSLNLADEYAVGPDRFMINGVHPGPGAGRWRDAEAIYNRLRTTVRQELLKPSDFEVKATARIEDGHLGGEVVVRGPAESGLRVQAILVERGVLCPGKAQVVVHRMVARAPLLGSLDGVEWAPEEGRMTLPFDRALADVTRVNEAFLDRYQKAGRGLTSKLSSHVDPRQVSVVAFIRDTNSYEILQAVHVDAVLQGEEGR